MKTNFNLKVKTTHTQSYFEDLDSYLRKPSEKKSTLKKILAIIVSKIMALVYILNMKIYL